MGPVAQYRREVFRSWVTDLARLPGEIKGLAKVLAVKQDVRQRYVGCQ